MNPNIMAFRIIVTIALASAGGYTNAQERVEFSALSMANRSPMHVIFLQPTPLINTPTTNTQWHWQLDGSSHSLIEQQKSQFLELDGESWQYSISAIRSISKNWSAHINIPLIFHSGGILDSLIDGWHSLTGLPDGQRDRQSQDNIALSYQDTNSGFHLSRPVFDLGDIELALVREWRTQRGYWSLQVNGKLPTGDLDKLTGSGAFDTAFLLNYRLDIDHTKFTFLVSGGVVYAGAISLANLSQRRLHRVATLYGAYNISARTKIETQLRLKSAPFRYSVPHLSDTSLAIDMGILWQQKNSSFRIGISEDIKVDSAPDVGFYFRYTTRS